MSRPRHYLDVLRRQEHRGKFLMSRVLWHSGLGRFFRIRRDGYRLRFYPSNLSAQLWLDPGARQEDEHFLREYLREGDCVIDVGANVGTLALAAAGQVGERGRVLAFEPNPRVCGFLRGNIRLNGATNILAYNVALGNESGRAIGLQTSKIDDMSQISEEGGGLMVPLACLDDYGDAISGEIALVKVDVEGYEKFVFEGAGKILRRTKCVMFEACAEQYGRFGCAVPEVTAILSALGFSIYRWRDKRLTEVSGEERCEKLENLLAVRDIEEFLSRTGYRADAGE